MAAEGPLTCRDTTWLVSESRDRPLADREMERLVEHIEGCPHCQIASQQFRSLFAQIDEMFAKDAASRKTK